MAYIMKCPLPEDVALETYGLVKKIRSRPAKKIHTDQMVKTLQNAVSSCYEYYFIIPLEIMEVSPWLRKIVDVGINTALGLTIKIGRRTFDNLSGDQLLELTRYIESFMYMEQKDNTEKEGGIIQDHFIICPVSQTIAKKHRSLIDQIRAEPAERKYTPQMLDITIDMTNATMDFYVVQAMEIIRAGNFIKKMVRMGINTGIALMKKISERTYNNLTADQMLRVIDYVDHFIDVRRSDSKIN